MPRDEGFFDLLERAGSNLAEAAQLLDGFLTEYKDIDQRAKQIRNIEHAGDHLTRETIEKLNRTFITPFDREEIHDLVSRMDDVLDRIDGAVARMVIYRISRPTEDAIALGKVVVRAAKVIQDTMPLLRDLKRSQAILNKCQELHTLESEGDRIEAHGLATLFQQVSDPIEVIKWKDVYEDLETATDRCQDVANVIESIVIRHT